MPPSLETNVEDENEEREEEEVGEGVDGKHDNAGHGFLAFYVERRDGVGEGSRDKVNIEGG